MEPSSDPGVYNLSGTPLPITSTSRMYIRNDPLFNNFGGYQPFQMDRSGRLLGQCIATDKKLEAGPYSRMYFKINDINYLCERQ